MGPEYNKRFSTTVEAVLFLNKKKLGDVMEAISPDISSVLLGWFASSPTSMLASPQPSPLQVIVVRDC